MLHCIYAPNKQQSGLHLPSPTFLFKTGLKLQSSWSGLKPLAEAACLCNTTWRGGDVLDDRNDVVVSAILRKADRAFCDIFRRISLLAVGCKLFALICLED